jgi:hypothetical protein
MVACFTYQLWIAEHRINGGSYALLVHQLVASSIISSPGTHRIKSSAARTAELKVELSWSYGKMMGMQTSTGRRLNGAASCGPSTRCTPLGNC